MSYRLPAARALSASPHDATRGGPPRSRECAVCLGQHEEEIHGATMRVRRWFREEVTKSFEANVVH